QQACPDRDVIAFHWSPGARGFAVGRLRQAAGRLDLAHAGGPCLAGGSRSRPVESGRKRCTAPHGRRRLYLAMPTAFMTSPLALSSLAMNSPKPLAFSYWAP